jgi:hypothetical protein
MNIHRRIVYLILFVAGFTTVSGQYEEKIKKIQQQVSRIDTCRSYTTKELNNSWFVSSGKSLKDTVHKLTGYYDKEVLVKILYVTKFLDTNNTEKLYFEKGQLIFMNVVVQKYPTKKQGAASQSYLPKLSHKASYFFNEQGLLEVHNFGKGPIDKLSREDKKIVLEKNTATYKAWLRE